MSDLVLYDLALSPNSMKVRIGLAYKGLSYEKVPVALDDQERARIVEVSGQPLTPVLTHGDVVVFDSAAILRYLDANFRDTPRLLPADRLRASETDRLERWARAQLVEPIGIVFTQLFSEAPDMTECVRASRLLNELTGEIERRLESSDWLVGDSMTLADVTAAPVVFPGMFPESMADMHPAVRFFHDNLKLGEGRERTREWCGRVVAYDR